MIQNVIALLQVEKSESTKSSRKDIVLKTTSSNLKNEIDSLMGKIRETVMFKNI